MQPELLTPSEKEIRALEMIRPTREIRERLDENLLEEEVDDNVRDLIIRLSSSTARGAFLANRLADIHRRIASGTSLTTSNEWFSIQNDEEETETDILPREYEEDEDEVTVPSPEIQSDEEVPNFSHAHVDDEDDSVTEISDNLSRPASVDSLVLAIDEAINILDPVNSQPRNPLLSVASYNSLPDDGNMRPEFNIGDDVDDGDDIDPDPNELLTAVMGDNNNDSQSGDTQLQQHQQQSMPVPDSSTAVTRYLIKHLPKQLTQLRNQKHELEDKIHDLEQVVSEQRCQMAEHERRAEMEKSKAKKLEESLSQVLITLQKGVQTDV